MQISSMAASVILFAFLIVSSVCAVDENAHLPLHKRQSQISSVGTGASSSAVPSSSSIATVTPSPSPSPSSSTRTTSRAPTSTPPPPSSTAEPPTTQEEPTSRTPTPSSENSPSASQPPVSDPLSSTALTTTTAAAASEAPAVTTTIVTVEGSSTISRVVTSKAPASSGTRATGSPSVNGGNDGSASSGLSTSQKNTIIGVVVGVVGAIIIGALAVVAWRIWGKKKHTDEDDLYDPNATIKEQSSSGSGVNPFKSTLDQYHNPAPVNTASNF